MKNTLITDQRVAKVGYLYIQTNKQFTKVRQSILTSPFVLYIICIILIYFTSMWVENCLLIMIVSLPPTRCLTIANYDEHNTKWLICLSLQHAQPTAWNVIQPHHVLSAGVHQMHILTPMPMHANVCIMSIKCLYKHIFYR